MANQFRTLVELIESLAIGEELQSVNDRLDKIEATLTSIAAFLELPAGGATDEQLLALDVKINAIRKMVGTFNS